jgi:hypothetical protein
LIRTKILDSALGLSIAVPIYDGHQKKMQYAKIDLQEQNEAGEKGFFHSTASAADHAAS